MSEPARRDVLVWGGAAALAVGAVRGLSRLPSGAPPPGADPAPHGYGIDPPLTRPAPAPWPRLFGERARRDLAALIDEIVPGLDGAPPGSAVGLVAFFDQWLGAPYPDMQADRAVILPLLADLSGLADNQPARRAERVARLRDGPFGEALARFCQLAAAAYHTTPAGIAALGFVGNEPRASFDGPPQAVLDHFDRAFAKLDFGP